MKSTIEFSELTRVGFKKIKLFNSDSLKTGSFNEISFSNRIEFNTNAEVISIKSKLVDVKTGEYQMTGINAQRGYSMLYSVDDGKSYKNLSLTFAKRDYYWQKKMSNFSEGKMYRFCIYFPILATPENLFIEIYGENLCLFPCKKERNTVAFLGGAHTLGIGVTTVSNSFANIIQRHYKVDIQNWGTNRWEYTPQELPIEELIDYNPKTIILECDSPRIKADSVYDNSFNEILDKLCLNFPDAFYILWSHPHTVKRKGFDARRDIILKAIHRYQNINIKFIDGKYLLNDKQKDLCTYSMYYLNEYGHIFIAKEVGKLLEAHKGDLLTRH